jgi:hypothetical protein
MFSTAEIWQVLTATGVSTYWTALALFGLLGALFLGARLPALVSELRIGAHQ